MTYKYTYFVRQCAQRKKLKSLNNRTNLPPEVELEQLRPAVVWADFEQVESALVGRQVNFLRGRAGL
jgi:hypothetical protein